MKYGPEAQNNKRRLERSFSWNVQPRVSHFVLEMSLENEVQISGWGVMVKEGISISVRPRPEFACVPTAATRVSDALL